MGGEEVKLFGMTVVYDDSVPIGEVRLVDNNGRILIKMNTEHEFVCADCGHEQGNVNFCGKCGSFRVILISIAEENFGKNWREECFGKQEPA